ncbi:sister chromatid cohesion protein PDS5 homolog D isoform X2 [Raphanus sativus]|uniref:Sister chromatid cohesion protein PDS5 homolog D isoform X2 n=1 Tax=Raphanus sativus TaxID=3726 RepID=A0A6J0KAE2_RAPSA|nr:sister chromatid cohesion protein PDS5 homolog D isoform X2 [Raphanus sativus]
MATVVGLTDLATSLIDAGNRLLKPPSSTDQLLALLDETESLLRDVGQDQPLSMQHALTPSKNALVQRELLAHPDSDVRVSLASCLTQIVRVAAPQAPYGDDQMKEIFRLTVEAFEKLADDASFSSRSYGKAEFVLDAMSRLNSCLVMLDLECHDLVLQMFRIFLRIIRSDHPSVVPSSMEMIMITVIDETDEVSTDLLDTLLTSVKKEKQNVSPMSWSLAEKVLTRCARTLQPYIIKAFKSTGTSLDLYSPVVSSICQTVFEAPKVHNAVNNTKENEDKVGGSKRPPREGTIRISSNDRVRKGNNSWSLSKHSLKQEVKSEGKKPRRASSLSLGKVAAKKTPPSLTGSVKRSRVSIGESDHDSDEEADQERDEVSEEEDDSKIKNSSKKKKKVVSSSGKGSSARTYTKKKNKSYTDDFAESLVGQRVNIWWPLDKTFYEGVIKSYCSSKKMHLILYTDGEKEQLNLIKERWELLEDLTSDSEDMKKDSGQAREGENLKSLNAETDRREEQEDVNSQSEDEYYNGEKQEQSGNKSKEKLKVADVEGEAKEEEKEDAKSETESEREGSESGEEPEWRETEDEAEEVDDGKVRSKKLA